ncbi:Serine/threonine-protein kinase-transforming protein Rmil [Phytophthora nicotianae]|uniref:Serine/threonine-protein kinase-transforming protein Rmil n=1 Tax=Phytophthora nicotianae TaxID=4792 RepID=A0A0W8DH39_PHYNI|nr:Serine/threonine-protein kinase-transforming protein Rmil [Phytophthora nicotianae]
MSAFGYLLDRSVGLPSRAYRDSLNSRQSTNLLQYSPSSSNFIFRQGMRVWGCSLDPVEQRFLLVGTSQSQLLVFDLQTLDEADALCNPSYNTTNTLDPICAVGAKTENAQTLQFGISMVDWYPVDGGLCISSSLDEHVKIWDFETFSCVSTLHLRSKVFGAKFSPVSTTHSLIAAATARGELRLVDMESGATAHSLLGHKDEIWTLDWSPASEFLLATGSRDGEIRLWDIRRSGATACLLCLNHEGKANVPGRSSLYTNVKREKPMSLSAAAKVRKRRRVGGAGDEFDVYPDGRFLLSNGMDEKLRLWNATSGEHQFMNYEGVRRAQPRAARNVQMAAVQEGGAWESTLVFVPNGSEGALTSYRVFGDSGAPIGSATAHYQQLTACLYRKTTRELYSAGEDGLIMKWKPPPVDLYPDIFDNENVDTGGQNGDSEAIAGATIGDEDAWSDDEEPGTSHEFIHPFFGMSSEYMYFLSYRLYVVQTFGGDLIV